MTESHFRDRLAVHLRSKMAAEGLSLAGVAAQVGTCSRNWVFRAAAPGEHDDERYEIGVPKTLIAALDWLHLEPRDFAEGMRHVQPGHVADAILGLDDYTLQQRRQLVNVVNAFLRDALRM